MTLPRLLLPVLLGTVLGAAPARAEPVLARYEVRAAGLRVMTLAAEFDLDGPRYRVRVHILTSGVIGAFSRGDQVTSTEGIWRGPDAVPTRYRADGQWRGTRRQVAIDYPSPGNPVLRALEPANDDREPVPDALQRGTVDALSALAKLTRTVATTGRCDGAAAVYDGRRRVDYAVRTDGPETLARDAAFAGPALRCAVDIRLLAGRHASQDAEEARKPQHATAWIGRALPGQAAIPVRIELPSRWFGSIRVLLTGVEALPSGAEVAQQRN